MPRSRSYEYGWHPDRPYDSEREPLPRGGEVRTWLTTTETADVIGLMGADDVRKLIKADRLPASRESAGGPWRIQVKDAVAWREETASKHPDLWCPPPGHEGPCRVGVCASTLNNLLARINRQRRAKEEPPIENPNPVAGETFVCYAFTACYRRRPVLKNAGKGAEAPAPEAAASGVGPIPP